MAEFSDLDLSSAAAWPLPPIPLKLSSCIPPAPPIPLPASDGRYNTLRLFTFGLANWDKQLISLNEQRSGAYHRAEVSDKEVQAALQRGQVGTVDLIIDARRFPNSEGLHRTTSHIGVHPDIIVNHRKFPNFEDAVQDRIAMLEH